MISSSINDENYFSYFIDIKNHVEQFNLNNYILFKSYN